MHAPTAGSPLSIGEFRFEPGTGELWAAHRRARLTPKASAVLQALAAHPQTLVTKAQLLDTAWAGSVVSEAALTTCIQELRDAFGDAARTPRYIETLHRRGYRLIAPVHLLRTPEPDGSCLVGREPELASLRLSFERACMGVRQIVFVAGEPGVGKTALVHAFLDELPTGSSVIARGQCIEHHGPAEAYLPVLDALGRLCREPQGAVLKAALAQHAPGWLAQTPGLLSDLELEAVQRRVLGAAPQRLLRELAEALEAIARSTPFVLWLDDLHWSDLATLDWLSFLARRTDPARLLVIGAYRPAEARFSAHPLTEVVGELKVRRLCKELQLGMLGEPDTETYFRRRFGDLPQICELARRVYARTEGQPLFVVNVADELQRRNVLVRRADHWGVEGEIDAVDTLVPGDVRAMVDRRIDKLSPADRRLLEAASVAGAVFASAAAAAAVARPVEEVESRLLELARRDALIAPSGVAEWPNGETSASFAFVHALYREAFYERLPAGARASLHARIGSRLEEAHAHHVGELAATLAVHFEQARDVTRAVRYRQLAARNAVRRGAPREAALHLERAREYLSIGVQTPETTRLEVELSIALGAQILAIEGWSAPGAHALYEHAQRSCRRLSDQRELFPALWGLWMYRWGRSDLEQANALCATLDTLAQERGDECSRLQAEHAGWATAFARGELETCCTRAERGLELYQPRMHHELAEHYGNHDAGLCARCFKAVALALSGRTVEARDAGAAAVELAYHLDHPFSTALTLFFVSILHQVLDDPGAAREHSRAAHTIAHQQGFALLEAWSSCVLAWSNARDGKASSLSAVNAAIRAARSTGAQQFQTYLLGLAASVALIGNDANAGLAAVREARAIAERTGERFYLRELERIEAAFLASERRTADS